MKTPEYWGALPRCAHFVSILAQNSSKDVKTSRCGVMTSCCDVMMLCRDIRCHDQMALRSLHRSHHKKIRKFFKMATLTLDLWPWPSNLSEILSKTMSLSNFRSIAQMVQPESADTQTWPILFPRLLQEEKMHAKTRQAPTSKSRNDTNGGYYMFI